MTDRARTLVAGLRLWARIVRSEPALLLAIAVATLAAATLVAVGARLVHQVSRDDLQTAVAQGLPEQRSVRLEIPTRIGAGPTGSPPFEQVIRRGDRFFDQQMPPLVQATIAERHFVVESPPFLVTSFPDGVAGPFPTSFRFRSQDDLEDQLTVTAGRLPGPRDPIPMLLGADCPTDRLRVDNFEPIEDEDCQMAVVAVHEVALTRATADDMGLDVGAMALLQPDIRDQDWFVAGRQTLQTRWVLAVSAIVELTDLSDDYWYEDPSLHRPIITENPDFRLIFAAGIFDPGEYGQLIRDIQEARYDYSWRFLVDPERLDPDRARDLNIELEKLGSPQGRVITRLPAIIDDYLEQRASTIGLLSTGFTGVLVVSGAAIFVLAFLAGRRQEPTVRLLQERGVGRFGLMSFGVIHSLAVVLPSITIALIVAAIVVPDGPWASTIPAIAAVGVTTVAMVTVALSNARPSLRTTDGGNDADLVAARRAVRDGFIVAVGAAAILIVRRRSGADDPADATADLDTVLAVAPAAVGIAVGVIVIRLAGPLIRAAATIAAFTSGLTSFLGLRRLLATTRLARPSMMVVLLAVAIAGFATTVRSTVTDDQRDNAWLTVGADLTVRGRGIGVPLAVPVDTVMQTTAATAGAVGVEFPPASPLLPDDGPAVNLLAIDSEAYRRLLADAPIDLGLLDALEQGDGSTVPAIISRYWPGGERPAIGDTIELSAGARVPMTVAAIGDTIPSLPAGQAFVVVDLDRLQGFNPTRELQPTVIYLRAPSPSDEVISELVELGGIGTRVVGRQRLLDQLRDDPFVAWANRGFGVLAIFAVALALAAAAAGLAISSPARRRDLALLSTLGLRPRQAAAMTALEHLSPVVLAVGAGTGLSLAISRLLSPALELDSFTGARQSVPLQPQPMTMVMIAVLIVLAVTAMTVVIVRAETARGRGSILSIGEEG